jgi:hypothetical protein
MNLYEIGTELQRLQDLLEESGGELSPELETHLEAIDLADSTKVQSYCHLIRNLDARAEAKRAESRRLAESSAKDVRAVDRLKARLHEHLGRTDRTSIDAGVFTVKLIRNSVPSVKYDGDPRSLPHQLVRLECALDREAVLKTWRAGHPLPEGITVTQGAHLRIG